VRLWKVFVHDNIYRSEGSRLIVAATKEEAEASCREDWDCADATEVSEVDGYRIVLEKVSA
jgi:hypothetical protein